MAINKRALIRYKILDRCFRNKYRRYYIDDLMEECAIGISEHIGKGVTVSRRQIFDDINFMKSDAGYSAPIESNKDGKKVYYRYDDADFGIERSPINPDELAQINDALEIFGRIKGLPNFEWVGELETKLRGSLDSSGGDIISFDHNPYLIGIEHLQELYNYIKNKATLKIAYQSFKMETPATYLFHPYHLKQYNNRWFLFGLNDELDKIQNLALDRIVSMEPLFANYKPCTVDFNEYFEDIVGVTDSDDRQTEDVVLEFSSERLPYVLSKPIHGSQKFKGGKVHLNLKINREFKSLILSFGSDVKVIEPESLKVFITEEARKLLNQ
jgi:predicted DNA-binding transcriptional regulator YafY